MQALYTGVIGLNVTAARRFYHQQGLTNLETIAELKTEERASRVCSNARKPGSGQ